MLCQDIFCKASIFKQPNYFYMKNSILIFCSALLLWNCTESKQQISLQNKIQGTWIDARYAESEKKKDTDLIIESFKPSIFRIPIGINFQENKLEYFRQFIEYNFDTITGKRSYNTFVGFVPYQLKTDSLFVQHPLQQKLVFKCTIDASLKDTLILKRKDGTYLRLVPLQKKEKDPLYFDQDVLSRSGCFGRCPIMNISIKRDGSVTYYGEKFTNNIGLYKGKISPEFTKYIFKKLEDIQISKVKTSYSVGHTDDETVSSTFLNNGTIVKTISDYGQAGTKELLWAYCATLNLDQQIQLAAIPFNEKISNLDLIYFEKDNKRLFLSKSETFLLWKALQSATIIPSDFEKKYVFHGGYFNSDIKRIESNGHLYTIYLKNGHITTYDIGYNFMEDNFSEADFRTLN